MGQDVSANGVFAGRHFGVPDSHEDKRHIEQDARGVDVQVEGPQ
jgi:hypothetical protein